jgi:high-affinity iron transporter
VWDINPILDETSRLGSFLQALFGYNGNPSLLEVIGYVAYLIGVGLLNWRGWQRPVRIVSTQAGAR